MTGNLPRRLVVLFITILMGALFCFYLWSGHSTNLEAASTGSQAAESTEKDLNGRARAAREAASLSASDSSTTVDLARVPDLPPGNIPLRDQIPALLARAEARDPIAVCRLVLDLNRCTEERRKIEFNARMIRSLEAGESPHDEMMIATVARTQERLTAAGTYCEGVDTSSLPAPASFLEQGVILSPHQKAILALMRPDGRIQRLRGEPSYSESALYVYPQFLADNAYRFLQDGFQSAEPLALEGLILVHSPSGAVSQKGVAWSLPDPRRFVTYLELLRRLQGDAVLEGNVGLAFTETRASLTPAQWEAVEREVKREFPRWSAIAAARGRPSTDVSERAQKTAVDCNR